MKIKAITKAGIEFDNGWKLTHFHDQSCCESVYADWMPLKDTSIMDEDFDDIDITFVKNYGIRINEKYGVACYDDQNGYYNSDLKIFLKRNNNLVVWDVEKNKAMKKVRY